MKFYFLSIMAKSKSGGTRSLIRGRVASDVYSIGRDAQGKRQQVVRSLAEVVTNPRTLAQMRSRMIMSTVMQAQSALKVIIDHSFDNVAGVQPNLSEFIRRNYALVKADVAAHPASGNVFGLVNYQEQGAKQGAYIISDGKAAIPAAVSFNKTTAVLTLAVAGTGVTFGALKEAFEIGFDGYMTIVGINANGAADYARLHLASGIADSTEITSSNLASCFDIEGDADPVLAISGQNITFTIASIANCSALIVTRKVNSGFIHSKAVLGSAANVANNANAALPTYPIGEQKFLNGGEANATSANPSNGSGSNDNPGSGGTSGGGSDSSSLAAPTISGNTNFTESTQVTISAADGATIYYTNDGTTPTTASNVYSSALTLSATTTIKAIAVKDDVTSSVASKVFTKSSGDDGMGQD